MNESLATDDLVRAAPKEIISHALSRHDRVAISFSGAEDVVLIDMACQLGAEFLVFALDTGRLHPQTYRFIERVRDFYGIEIDVLSPSSEAVDQLVREKGLFSFYRDGHNECCSIRKIEPLRRYLADIDAWITGQRQDQGITRTDLPVVQEDTAFSDGQRLLMKYNPLACWTSAQVWQYIRDNQVPYNELHDLGYPSIGCEPCTRPVGPHQSDRNGRWWWEAEEAKECGLHVINLQ